MLEVRAIAQGYANYVLNTIGQLDRNIVEMGERRFRICEQDEEYFNPQDKRCKLCGCDMVVKTLAPIAYCPMGYWKSEKIK